MIVTLSKSEVTCLGNTVNEKKQKLQIFESLCKHRKIDIQTDSDVYTLIGVEDKNELELILKLTDEI